MNKSPQTLMELHHQDCLEGMRALPAASVDLAVTSPPYNLNIAYSKFADDAPREEFLAWCYQWASEIQRLMKQDASFFLNVGSSPKNPWFPHELILSLRPLFSLQNTFHWIKSITVQPKGGLEVSAGHFKPINSERFVTDCHEYVFHLTKTGSVPLKRLNIGVEYVHKSNIARWKHTDGADKRCRGNNWFVPYETIKYRDKDRPHPATFPVQLAEWCMRIHGVDASSVAMDPFLGIGSSAVAARRCGVSRFIGFEIDEQYLSVARERLTEEPELEL